MDSPSDDILLGKARLARIEKSNLLLGVLLAVGSLPMKSIAVTLSVILGSIFQGVNFRLLRRIVEGAVLGDAASKKALIVRVLGKFFVLLGGVTALFFLANVRLIPFFIGASSLVGAIVYHGLVPPSPRESKE